MFDSKCQNAYSALYISRIEDMNSIKFCEPEVPIINISGSTLDRMNISKDYYYIVDCEHRCYFANENWYRLHGLMKCQSIEGIPYSGIPHKAFYSCSDRFEAHDQDVLRTGKPIPSLEIHEYDYLNGWLGLFLIVEPIVSNEGICGLACIAKSLPKYYFEKHFERRCEIAKCNSVQEDCKLLLTNPDNIHDAEFDTAYLYMIGLKPKQIAYYRKISDNTVYSILKNIRHKLGLEKNDQIKDYGMDNNWYDYVPNMFRNIETALRLIKLPNGRFQ